MITETKTRRVEPGITIFEISGRLNLGNSLMSVEISIQRVIDEGARKLVLDLTGLSAIDSSGIGLLVTSASHMEQCGGHVRVAGASGTVGKVLQLAHLDRIAPLDADVESACRHLTADTASA